MPLFSQYIGIDYSGEGEPTQRLSGLQVYRAQPGCDPQQIFANNGGTRWSRKALAEWLKGVLAAPGAIVGIDHAFSFPKDYLGLYCLKGWDAFLRHFCATYDTLCLPVNDFLHVPGNVKELRGLPHGIDPIKTLRITERRSGTAFSVFDFRPHGVAYSSFAGIPWLRYLRRKMGAGVHWWPYDGWNVPPGCSVIVEAYPTVCRANLTSPLPALPAHQRDACAIAAWLADRDKNNLLTDNFAPALTSEEREIAEREGWIIGVV